MTDPVADIQLTDAQRALMFAMRGFDYWADPLDIMKALRGPLRDPTMNVLIRHGLIEQSCGGPVAFRVTEKGWRWLTVHGG